MAWLAEVRITPAEPLSDRAAEFALELDKIRTVLRAVLDSAADGDCCTLTADKLFFLPSVVVVSGCIAVLHTTEVWIATFEAHVVRELFQGKALQIVVECVARLLEARVLVEIFKLRALHGHLDDASLEVDLLLDDGL